MASRSFDTGPARRDNAIPLIGLYGQSGTGKTLTALLMARGIVGPQGVVVLIDTESGRGEAFSDIIPGGYQVVRFWQPPFSPNDYMAAIDKALSMRADIVVIDSASHEWEGEGGVLNMAGEIEERTKKAGLHCWKDPKLKHQRFVLKLLQSPVPVIVCMRAKFKSRQVRGNNGKNEIVKDEHSTPVQADDFIFEMSAHAEMLVDGQGKGGMFRLTKCSPPSLRECFPEGQRLGTKVGEAIAVWARGGSTAPAPQAAPTTAASGQPDDALKIAQDVASMGRSALDRHYTSQPNAIKKVLYSHMADLVAIADQADAENQDDPPPGFDDEPGYDPLDDGFMPPGAAGAELGEGRPL
jgi:hypothetical protein